MPRVTQQVARKDYPKQGIKKGDRYYKWKFRFSPVVRSLTMPQPEQLTQSPFQQEWIPLDRDIGQFDGNADDLQEIIDRVNELVEQPRGGLENMPESLQESDTGYLLQERIDHLENLAGELDQIHGAYDEEWAEDSDERSAWHDEVQSHAGGL